jgi:exopolysaccharide biosynthesis polyprenyl glycosylphosphotransferase
MVGAILLSNLAFAGLLYMSYRDVPRLLFLYSAILQFSFLIGLRLLLYAWRHLHYGDHGGAPRVLVVGAGRVGLALARRIRTQGDELTLVGYLDDDPDKLGQVYEDAPVLGTTAQATALVVEKQIEEVIFALPLRAHQSLETLVLALQAMPVRVRVVPDFFDLAFFRATIEDFDGIPLIGLRDPAITGTNRLIKRLLDLVVAGVGLVLAAPLMLGIAIAIRLDSSGPAIFRQQRVGENGRQFTIYKFRSMQADAEEHQQEVIVHSDAGVLLHKRPDDPRVTRVGRFLRRTSLDELPQLVNVLKGDMSLVGPRPEMPFIVAGYKPWQRRRLRVRPGLTGLWQIMGRKDLPLHETLEYDFYYIKNQSLLMDLTILLKTIPAILRGKGAF